MNITLKSPYEWIKFNINDTLFVRINHDQEGWRKITNIFRSSIESNRVVNKDSEVKVIIVCAYVHVNSAYVLYAVPTLVLQCNVYNTLYMYTSIVCCIKHKGTV